MADLLENSGTSTTPILLPKPRLQPMSPLEFSGGVTLKLLQCAAKDLAGQSVNMKSYKQYLQQNVNK